MSEYMNHKWQNFVRETRNPRPTVRQRLDEKMARGKGGRSTMTADSQGAKEKSIKIPKLRISEEWGKPAGTSDDRDLIEIFFSRLPQGDFRSKIEHIEKFINDCGSEVCGTQSTSDILANLMVLDALSSIIYGYTEQGGGYLFEAFIAALLGGSAQQVKAKSGEGIQDIVTQDGAKVSIKFMTGKGDDEKSKVTGSLNNLRATLGESGEGMRYIVAIKIPGGKDDIAKINFLEFDLGTNGKYIIPEDPDAKGAKFFGLDQQRPTKKRKGVPLVYAEDFIVPQKSIAEEDENAIYLTDNKAPRFSVDTSKIINKLKRGNVGFYELTLGSRDRLKAIADSYATQINDNVLDIYESLDKYGTNLNLYLVQRDVAAGPRAINDARTLKDRTIKVTRDMPNE
jgi:hypothetical protein